MRCRHLDCEQPEETTSGPIKDQASLNHYTNATTSHHNDIPEIAWTHRVTLPLPPFLLVRMRNFRTANRHPVFTGPSSLPALMNQEPTNPGGSSI